MRLTPGVQLICALMFGAMISRSAHAEEGGGPVYLRYPSDVVQQVYSKALLGFAIDQKCGFLSRSVRSDYERHLNSATEIFRGYVLAKCMARNPAEAIDYPKDMVRGAMRFAVQLNCDARAREGVSSGFETARDFMSRIDGELRKPLTRCTN